MGAIRMIKGSLLAWKLCSKGRIVIGDVVDHSGINTGLEFYRREEGEETVNIRHTDAWHDKKQS